MSHTCPLQIYMWLWEVGGGGCSVSFVNGLYTWCVSSHKLAMKMGVKENSSHLYLVIFFLFLFSSLWLSLDAKAIVFWSRGGLPFVNIFFKHFVNHTATSRIKWETDSATGVFIGMILVSFIFVMQLWQGPIFTSAHYTYSDTTTQQTRWTCIHRFTCWFQTYITAHQTDDMYSPFYKSIPNSRYSPTKQTYMYSPFHCRSHRPGRFWRRGSCRAEKS